MEGNRYPNALDLHKFVRVTRFSVDEWDGQAFHKQFVQGCCIPQWDAASQQWDAASHGPTTWMQHPLTFHPYGESWKLFLWTALGWSPASLAVHP